MPSWWGKSSSKEAKKRGNKESIIDTLHRKFKSSAEDNNDSRSGGSRRRCSENVSDRGSLSRVPSRSTSPSTQVSRCQSFAERPAQRSHAQPLPLPKTQRSNIVRSDSNISAPLKSEQDRNVKLSVFPLPKPGVVVNRADPADTEGDVASASCSSGSSSDSDDPTESRLLSPLTSDYENGNKTAINSPSSVMKNEQQSPDIDQKNWKETFKPSNLQFNNQPLSTSPKKKPSNRNMQNIQIPPRAFYSAPDSSMSSPSRSPLRAFGAEQFVNSGFWVGKTYPDITSAHCSSPGSGHNSGHNSVGGDLSGQLFWQPSRCSPEYSTNTSPRMISPGPSSQIHSGTVTPLHPRASGGPVDSPTTRPDDGKQQSHPLPLPPLAIVHTSPFSPTYSAPTTPSVPRSPGRAENPTSPRSRWKKGRLIGRGTFGHVYLGFNSESGGEMCAMKEVTLFFDDPKSRDSAQQLGQEIALLSRLQHPNIVQYYGSETIDDKLYIYLEYVSGGSIYKLLQDYGQFGEVVIRSYTHQILSGLAYLHNKHTVHRDIKGANILVDPSGRVKLADFGMAKHISGQSCPLSFKGSPYWMAPEVIKNSNGCNLTVDIWSLGCTVLEMATTKPPWSQYEGVAAMFKIGNSKELPAIPDHLSADGKDFVLKCLQRNPANRPSALRLLEHPFVKNAAPLQRPIMSADTLEGPQAATNASRSPVPSMGNTRNYSSLESDWMGNYHSRGSKISPVSSDIINIPRNISCPVSPIGSPLLHSRSPQHLSGRMSPSPISSPRTMSGASTPLTGGSCAIPFHNSKQPSTYHHDAMGTIPRRQTGFYTTGSSPYHDQKPELFRGLPQASQAFRDIISSENCTLGTQSSHLSGSSSELYDAQSVLADRLSAAFERPRKV